MARITVVAVFKPLRPRSHLHSSHLHVFSPPSTASQMLALATILILSAVAFTNGINTLDSFKDLCPPLDNNNALIDAGSFPPDFSSITCFYLDSAACTYSFAVRSILSPFICTTLIYLLHLSVDVRTECLPDVPLPGELHILVSACPQRGDRHRRYLQR
jgi:hypothetical protein